MPLRLVFMGTPDFAVPALLEIVGQHDIVAVYTRAPRPAGRGMGPQQSPIAREAARLGVPIFTPKTLKDATAASTIGELKADAAVVVAYGLILPKAILDLFPRGCFNLHASLLPRWRGAAPIQRAIMTGDNDTGVMVMKMEESLDAGPIAMAADPVPIGADMTAGELHGELATRGARLTKVALAALERGSLQLTPQSNEGVTYADKIEKSETRIDWTKSWSEVHNHIRGLSPFPGAWFEAADIGRVKVLRSTKGEGTGKPGQILDDRLTIACGDGAVQLVEVQRAGKQPMPAKEFLRGTPVGRDYILS